MKSRNFNKIKNILMKKKALILKSVKEIEKDITEKIENRHGDDADLAEADHEQEMSLFFKNRGQDELRQIDEALERIRHGDYGVCEECGEDIPKKRLEVQPYSLLCVECQEKIESGKVAR